MVKYNDKCLIIFPIFIRENEESGESDDARPKPKLKKRHTK